ncbi:TY-Chap domain-containing protein [Actinomadura nitritigenes]|uniref:TY-Chap domain-containing protein n=1 Tax=Actinomadura nitritigenes TaxID=134602 RepID=UPI003D8E0BE9
MLEWSEFARRLGRELAGLDRDTILIVRERDESRHYVQAMREPDRLYAEAVSNNFLDGPLLLTPADEEVMSDAGWRPPADPAPRNWWTELPEAGTPGGMRSVAGGDYSRLADVMVTALRDVQGVRRPSDLVYESFHRHGNGLIELLDFGIETADPSRVSKRRSSAAIPPPEPAPESARPAPGPPPAGPPMPLPPPGVPGSDADLLEPRLAEAKERGDHATYFDLLAGADLVLPATAHAVENPDRAELPTITIGTGTYVTLYTSPGALARTGDQHPLYRRTTFALLAAGWPDPSWQLAVNPGLPSEVLLDASALGRLEAAQRETSSAAPEVPNPYGTVDPGALSGPGAVAGGPPPMVNGSGMPGFPGVPGPSQGVNGSSAANGSPVQNGLPSFNGIHGVNGLAGTDDFHDDSGTAIDPYTAEELRAALEAGTPDLGRAKPATPEPPAPEPSVAAPLGAPTDGTPADGDPAETHLPAELHQPGAPQPDARQPSAPQPGAVQPEAVQPDAVQPQVVQPQAAQPEAPQFEAPQLEAPQLEAPRPPAAQPGVPQPDVRPQAMPETQQQPEVHQPDVQTAGQPVAQPAVAQPAVAQPPAGIPMQPPHGTRLWRSTGDDDEAPVAVYDAIGGVWSPARTDAVPAPRAE